MGTNVMVAAVGLVVGPILGGWLVGFGWQWVFWFNVPLGSSARLGRRSCCASWRAGTPWAATTSPGTCSRWAGSPASSWGCPTPASTAGRRPMVIVGLAAAAVHAPAFVWVESRSPAPMLDLWLFRIRVYSAAAAAAFLNGLSRFALMFLFVFYFQGPQGDDPITAGIKLTPLAAGMLVSSPLAGWWADRHGSRAPAVLRDAAERRGPRRDDDARGGQPLLAVGALAGLVGRRLGHLQLAQHQRDDGRGARRGGGASPRARGRCCRTPGPSSPSP